MNDGGQRSGRLGAQEREQVGEVLMESIAKGEHPAGKWQFG